MKSRKGMQKSGYDRREFLRDASIAASIALVNPGILLGGAAETEQVKADDVMDDALERLAGLAILTNHGPMAAEALVALGCKDRVVPFVEAYRNRFRTPYPQRSGKIDPNDWRSAIGREERAADWGDFFRNELKEAPWNQVVSVWVDRLAPGLSAAAAHGLIRTAHAARSLAANQSRLRLDELADGLAYWAAYYQTLPEINGNSNQQKFSPRQAIQHVPLISFEKRRRGSIMIGLRSLEDLPAFAGVANLVVISGNPDQFLSELTETFAEVYVRNVTPGNFIALIHSVTGTTAIRTLLPHLTPETTQKVLRYGWQMAAGLYSISPPETKRIGADEKDVKSSNLLDQAITTLEEHAIKFTEACLREYKRNPKPVYLQAAADAVSRLR